MNNNNIFGIELYKTPTGELEIKSDNGVKTYLQEDKGLTNYIYTEIEENYPEAHAALNLLYKGSVLNLPYFKYLCVHRFLRCNCGNYDKVLDVDSDGKMHFEFVECPIRGRECLHDGVICSPKFKTNLSDRELEVMELLCDGYTTHEAANKLFIALTTVLKHKSNAFARKNTKTMTDFMVYANKHNIFNK